MSAVVQNYQNFPLENIQIYISKGKKGGEGGDSGKRGCKGLGGYSGIVRLQNLSAKILEGDGIDGQDGKKGLPGKGGINVCTFRGYCMKQNINREIYQRFKKVIFQPQLRAQIFLFLPYMVGSYASKSLIGVIKKFSSTQSDQWLYLGFIEDGIAPSGKIIMDINFDNREEPSEPFQLKDPYVNKLEEYFKFSMQEFIKSIEYKTSFFE